MSTNEQLAWDFDDGDVAEVRPDTGIARFAPGSEQWIAALQPTDDDAIRLDRFDVNTMTAEAAARLWARVAAWVESDQIAYYIDDSPVSSDAAYDARSGVPLTGQSAVAHPSRRRLLLQRLRLRAPPQPHDEP